jgi:hypothetical protein
MSERFDVRRYPSKEGVVKAIQSVVMACLLSGCGTKSPAPGEELTPLSGCDSIDPSLCALPFPSSAFLVPDENAETGQRVSFGETALPKNRDGIQIRPDYWNEKDGFSTNSHMMTFFEGLSDEGLLSWRELDGYTGADVSTVIVDTTTGERVPHFAEIDANLDDPAQAVLLLRPVEVLEHNRRYVVGIRGLTKQSGGAVDVSEDFAALRDGTSTQRSDVESRREHFDTVVFPALEETGFSRSELQIAWDFHTVSQENSLGRMLWMRDDAYARYPAGGPSYTIQSVEDADCVDGVTVGRTINGTVTVPLYMEADHPGTVLTRDDKGMPFYNGDTEADFMIRVPCSLITDPRPAPILQYGHGLLGERSEARSGYLGEMINTNGWVLLAMDWTGMASEDVMNIVLMSAGDPSDFAMIPERSMQGFVEKLAGMRMLMGDFADDEVVKFPASDGNLVSLIDGERRYYYGNSQGAILGGALVALSPDIERAVLGVGGFPYAMLLSRSADFETYFLLFKEKFPDSREVSLLVNGLVQQLWDPGEAAGYAYAMNRDPLENTPAKDVLLQVAQGDPQVSTLGAHVMARSYGAKAVYPGPALEFGIEEAEAPFEGSAYVEWFYPDGAVIPLEDVPPSGLDPHECPRRAPEAQQQLVDFLRSGVVNQYCDGPCEGLVMECH